MFLGTTQNEMEEHTAVCLTKNMLFMQEKIFK